MAAGRMRSTRRLRSWIVEQVSSGKYPGLVWDDEAKTMFRIPWKHAGKQDFRKDEDAAIFKAWAEFKGKLTEGGQDNPASWKTRLRCALNKSPEFKEVMERAQLDISEPYKVYRLVPFSEQGLIAPEKKCREKSTRRSKRRSSELDSDDASNVKQIKTEEELAVSQLCVEDALLQSDIIIQAEEPVQYASTVQRDGCLSVSAVVDEIRLDVRIEETVPDSQGDQDSFNVEIHYLGQEVLRRQIQGTDVRITYLPSSPVPPTPAALKVRFPRIPLPEPPSTLPAGQELQALFTLLPFMEKGVLLTSGRQGVYGKRFCQGRVFWTGPHTTTPGLHKMERNNEPVLLFSKDVFKQQLDQFRSNGGEPPQCGVTLCFGEELNNTEDPSRKLIIVKITFPWAEQQIQNAQSIFESITILQSLASQSPLGEITLNLVTVPSPTSDTITCGTF
ncbi:interferon regulatory factor 9-like isoform X1 [Seriola lalandi dorsalis]|uniref:interferon regulatory factor 9-like isoform X1 n=1 Tax=Seriola lalandi dorsalis TaxID=1841481 RepID=UPI000C6FB323|nr:interferon regulatory factor 9-like isoform X1 [Seriola lalandi dorsalis]XP_056220268.1 interferon regulatory factor 9 isoform X1 [Seriola aureovittata]